MSQPDQVVRSRTTPAADPRPDQPLPTNGQSPRSPMATTQVPASTTSLDGGPVRAQAEAAPARPDQTPRAQPAGAAGVPAPAAGPRKVLLTVARVDPWSVLKLSFLLSVALGIGLVTASVVLWSVLDSMGVFSSLNDTLRDIGSSKSEFDVYSWVGLGRVVSLSTFIAVLDVVLIMALSTLGALLYNLASSLVGGLQVTLSDD